MPLAATKGQYLLHNIQYNYLSSADTLQNGRTYVIGHLGIDSFPGKAGKFTMAPSTGGRTAASEINRCSSRDDYSNTTALKGL